MLTHEAHRPREGAAAGASHTGVDEGVEHGPLGLTQPGAPAPAAKPTSGFTDMDDDIRF